MSDNQPPYNQPDGNNPQQPYYNQQPNQPPPWQPQPPQGYQQPPVQPPKKKTWPWIAGGCGCLTVLAIIGFVVLSGTFAAKSVSNAVSTVDTSSAVGTTSNTQPATTTGKWTTVQTFTGNGAKKTAIFTAPDDWKIVYSCQGMDISGTTADANLIVSVTGSDGTPLDYGAVNTICKAGKTTSDSTEEHQGGQVYLDINADAQWTIQIQELK